MTLIRSSSGSRRPATSLSFKATTNSILASKTTLRMSKTMKKQIVTSSLVAQQSQKVNSASLLIEPRSLTAHGLTHRLKILISARTGFFQQTSKMIRQFLSLTPLLYLMIYQTLMQIGLQAHVNSKHKIYSYRSPTIIFKDAVAGMTCHRVTLPASTL